jgi:hypothetical protein
MGKVCERHQEWCPTGECRWCEPEKAAGPVLRSNATPARAGTYFPAASPVSNTTAVPVVGAWAAGYDLVSDLFSIGDYRLATGAIPAVTQANGLTLPGRPAIESDPALRDDIREAMREARRK